MKASSSETPSSYPQTGGMTKSNAMYGVISALISLFIVPEIFGPVAIVLGAYTWKREEGNRGLYVLIFGIVCMLVGIYFTSFFALVDLISS